MTQMNAGCPHCSSTMLSGWTQAQVTPVLDGLQHNIWLLSLLA